MAGRTRASVIREAGGSSGSAGSSDPHADPGVVGDRRHRRREQTINEILDTALVVMASEGVAGLTMAAIARRMRVTAPSLYKYFASLTDVYDSLVARGHADNLRVVQAARVGAEPGRQALLACSRAAARWAVDNPVLAQLLFWRPVPTYEPNPAAFSDALAVVDIARSCLAEAVQAGQLARSADTDEALDLLSILHFGVISQHLANDPHGQWPTGRYVRLYDTAINAFLTTYQPEH